MTNILHLNFSSPYFDISNFKVHPCLAAISRSARLMAALRKCNATHPLDTVGVLIHVAGSWKELKLEEYQAAKKVLIKEYRRQIHIMDHNPWPFGVHVKKAQLTPVTGVVSKYNGCKSASVSV